MEPTSYRESFEDRQRELIAEIDVRRAKEKRVREVAVPIPQFLFRLGRQPVHLSLIEYRIISFLSEHPYKAFTRAQIIAAVDAPSHRVNEATLDEHIKTLRDKLGLFSDYVQSVPHIGYRFKP